MKRRHTESVTSSAYAFRFENGRRYHVGCINTPLMFYVLMKSRLTRVKPTISRTMIQNKTGLTFSTTSFGYVLIANYTLLQYQQTCILFLMWEPAQALYVSLKLTLHSLRCIYSYVLVGFGIRRRASERQSFGNRLEPDPTSECPSKLQFSRGQSRVRLDTRRKIRFYTLTCHDWGYQILA
jgi:hypothetical protein